MAWNRLPSVAVVCGLLAAGCPLPDGKDGESSETGLVCPRDVDSFCEYEFGGACPTFEEAAAMTCDGYHFDPAGKAGEPPTTTDGDEGCSYPIVGCAADDASGQRTALFFTGQGAGTVHMVDLVWVDEPVCTINGVLADFIDC